MTPAELRAAMSALPYPQTDKLPPHWEFWRADLWKLVVRGDDPNNFFSWPCVFHTMLTNHWKEPVRIEYETLPKENVWFDAILATKTGQPADYHALTPFSRNLIHQAYHIHRFQTVTGKQIAEIETIVEIGGGYGALCLVARRLGFKGKYIIYDLPEFSLLQQWYLSQVGIEGVEFVSELPNRRQLVDLMIGMYSLSEMPLELRDKINTKWTAYNYLLLYSGKWETYDNMKWFQEYLKSFHKDAEWQHEELTHLPDRFNYYTFGWTK